MAIIGGIDHSRVARSNIIGLTKMGAEVAISGSPTMIPLQVESLGVKVIYDPEGTIKNKDVIMVLWIQFERQSKILFPRIREYSTFFGLNREMMLRSVKKDVIVMHPWSYE